MARKTKQTTSLWSVIESMQQRLEAEGLDRDVVDAAVTRGLEALLDIAPPVRAPAMRGRAVHGVPLDGPRARQGLTTARAPPDARLLAGGQLVAAGPPDRDRSRACA